MLAELGPVGSLECLCYLILIPYRHVMLISGRSGPTHLQTIMMAAKAVGVSLVLLSVSSGAMKVPCGFIQPPGVHSSTAAVIRWTPMSQTIAEPLRSEYLEGSWHRKHIILYDGPMGRGPGPQVRLTRTLGSGCSLSP